MSYVPLRDLGKGGVVRDLPPYSLPPNVFSGGENTVFRDGRVSKLKGWQPVQFAPPSTDPGMDCYWFNSWQVDGSKYTAFFGSNQIKVWNGNALNNATIPSMGIETTWVSENYGKFLVAVNGSGDPIYNTADDGSTWATLPGWNDADAPQATCRSIRAYRSYLVALGVDGQPYTVYFSNQGRFGAIPDNWATADPTSFAASYDLQAADGPIVDAAVLGDSLIVYTTNAAYAFTSTGNIKAPMSMRRLFSRGIAAPEAVQAFENLHLCVSDKLIYIHDGSTIQRVADKRIETYFYGSLLANQQTIKTALNDEDHELMIYFAAKGATDVEDEAPANKCLTYNYLEDAWSIEDFGTEVYCIKQSDTPGGIVTWADLDELGWTWEFLDNNNITWADLEDSRGTRRTFQLEARKWSERGMGSTRDGQNYFAHVERTYIDMDEVRQTNEGVLHFDRILPQLQGSGEDIYFQIGVSTGPDGAIRWKTPRPWSFLKEQYKIDIRGTGRYLSWRVGTWANAVPVPPGNIWELASADINVTQDGWR